MVSSFGHNTTLCYIINQDQHGRTNINYSTARNAGSTYFPGIQDIHSTNGIQDIHSTNHWLRGLKEKHEGLLSGICCKKPPSVFCLRTRECRTLTLGRGTSSSSSNIDGAHLLWWPPLLSAQLQTTSHWWSKSIVRLFILSLIGYQCAGGYCLTREGGRLLGIDEEVHSLTEASNKS